MLIFFMIAQTWSVYLDSSLAYIGLDRKDISFRTDFTPADDFRFAKVDEFFTDPLSALDFTRDMSELFKTAAYKEVLKSLVSLYGFDINNLEKRSFPVTLTKCHELTGRALADTAPGLLAVFEELTLYSPDLTTSIEQERESEQRYDSLVAFLKKNAQTIDYPQLFQAGAYLIEAIAQVDAWLEKMARQSQNIAGVSGNVLYYTEYDFGAIVVGDTGKNIYTKDFSVIIDLGGDDEYVFNELSGHLHLIIDKAGDDVYEAGDYALACGRFGVSLLLDEQGDDMYRAHNYSLGCGVFGMGWLIDRVGSDLYFGDTFTQGAGGFGMGILWDRDGHDLYHGALHAQGFASTYGIGILADQTGNDQYVLLKKYTDEIRYLDHYLSFAQGFSCGFRPDLSAGIGLLLDAQGNDYYLADIFAQGGSYWYGMGGLVDGTGNDVYIAYQYAQGSGVHLAVGILVDRAGNDYYASKGVSQGCGHDLATGLLFDISGDDSYLAYDLSQGAGSANGFGLLLDESGDDNYSVKSLLNTQGYGDPRREYSSIGLLIDIKGKDTYSSGADQTLWKKGDYGLSIDWE
jgi:hypothetical protein